MRRVAFPDPCWEAPRSPEMGKWSEAVQHKEASLMSPHKANPHTAGQLECASVVWKVGEDGSLSQKNVKGSTVLLPFHLSLALVLNQGIPRRESFCTLQCYPLIFPWDLGLYHWERWPQQESWGPTSVEVTTHSEKRKSSFLEEERKRPVWLPFQKALPAECWESGHGHY